MCLQQTRAAWQNTIELIIISDAVYRYIHIYGLHWMRRGMTQQIPDRKLLPRSIHDVLTQISNDFCVDRLELLRHQYVSGHVSGVDTAVLLAYQEETKQPLHPIAGLPLLEFSPVLSNVIYTGPTSCLKPSFPHTFSSFVFFPPSLSFCCSARLMSSALSALSCTS